MMIIIILLSWQYIIKVCSRGLEEYKYTWHIRSHPAQRSQDMKSSSVEGSFSIEQKISLS